ncbi:MAG: MFS transporter [Acidimicrobiales bacterium]
MEQATLRRAGVRAIPEPSVPGPSVARPPAAGRSGAGPVNRQSVFLFVVLAAQLMVVLDATIVNVALPHIRSGLGFSAAGLSWVLNAYVLTFGGLMLLGARSGDLLGRRRTFLLGVAVFSVGSLLGGFAGSPAELLAARAFQGIGAAFAAPSSLGLLTAVFPEGQQRVRAIALFTTVSAAGGAVGLVSGGLLVEWLSWRWVMFVNVPVGIVVLALGSRVIAETPRRSGQFDILGAVMSTAAIAGLVLGLVEAGSVGWSKPLTVAPLVAGVLLLATFVRNERRAAEPILPMRLLTNLTRTSANVARGLVYAGTYGVFFFLSQFLQNVQGYSPLRSGLTFLPVPVLVFLASQFGSRLLGRGVRPKSLMLAGTLVALVSLLLTADLSASSSLTTILVDLALFGVGMGLSLVSLTAASLAGVEPRDAGAASGVVNVVQQLGAALGLAILVTVFSGATHTAGRGTASAVPVVVHGLHEAFFTGSLFALAALALVALGVRVRRPEAPAQRAVASHRPLSLAEDNVEVDDEELSSLADYESLVGTR